MNFTNQDAKARGHTQAVSRQAHGDAHGTNAGGAMPRSPFFNQDTKAVGHTRAVSHLTRGDGYGGSMGGVSRTGYANQDSKAKAITMAVSRLRTKLRAAKGNAKPPKGFGSGSQKYRVGEPGKASPSPATNTQLWQTRARGTTEKRPLGGRESATSIPSQRGERPGG